MAEVIRKTAFRGEIAARVKGMAGWQDSITQRRMIVPLALLLILSAAALFRFSGLNWDQDQHLHPDERFLTMVADSIQWPAQLSWRQYFDTAISPLSPYNHDFEFYVYGTLPLYLAKWVAIWQHQIEYNQLTYLGRLLSAFFDLGTIVCLFLLGRRLYGTTVGLVASALLALNVLSIQQSHFFTVDTFANFFAVLTFYFAVRASKSGGWIDFSLMGLALGAGLACKLNLAVLGLVVLLATGVQLYRLHQTGTDLLRAMEQVALRLIFAGLLTVLVFRLLQPIAFQGPGFFNFTLNPQWLANMQEIGQALRGETDSPPGHQWAGRIPLWFPWRNMVLWGMGLPLGTAAWAGFMLAVYQLLRNRQVSHLLPVTFVGLVFLYQGTQWVATLRYFLPLYPILILLAAYLLQQVWGWAIRTQPSSAGSSGGEASQPVGTQSQRRWLALLVIGTVVGGTFLYALAFSSIYRRPHTRVQASAWIYEHIPAGKTLAVEHWDDGLPLNLNNFSNDRYRFVSLTNYDEDTPQKLDQLVEKLQQADSVVLSSNRLYDSIPRLPLRYPMTTRYYDLLFAEKLGFQKVAEFVSYPRLMWLSLPDQGAEEAFSVYDHPKVTIFRKTIQFDAGQVRHLLGDGIDFDRTIKMMAKPATKAPTGLMFSAEDRQLYTEAGTWSSLFDHTSWGNRWPVLAWILALFVLGLIAWPVTFVTLGNLEDKGYGLSRAIGWLCVGWVAWLLASNRLLPFQIRAIGVSMVLLLVVSAATAWIKRRELAAFMAARWRLILCEEVLWWALFFFMLWIRWLNPDLWHPERGGEKPMDFAYLNAIVRSAYFPPYDPWFAGGFVNYYYFGFVLVATLIKLTGVVPGVAYNLAVPTFFAMTAVASFSAALSLAMAARRPGRKVAAGILAIAFVALIGNLGQVQILWQEIQSRGSVQFETRVPALLAVANTLDGLSEVAEQGFALADHPEKWYWNASRLIPHPDTEPGPINEFPLFTFLFADLHAHLMALPFTLLVLALAISLIGERPVRPRQTTMPPRNEEGETNYRIRDGETQTSSGGDAAQFSAQDSRRRPVRKGRPSAMWVRSAAAHLSVVAWHEALVLAALGLAVGALWTLNTWDWPTYGAVVGLALACRQYARRQQLNLALVGAVIWRWALVLSLSYLFFWPFHQHYASGYGGFTWWHGSRTPLSAYITIHGFFLFLVCTYLAFELMQGKNHNALIRLMRSGVRSASRLGRFRNLYGLVVQPSPGYILALRTGAFVLVGALILFGIGYRVPGLIVLLMALVTLLWLSPRPAPRRQFTLGIIGLGLGLTLVPEVIVLAGDVGRMNTVFKFYLQVWIMWAVAAAAFFPWIAASIRRCGKLRWLWWSTFALLLAACLLYPLLAIPARVSDRFATSTGRTLDGTAYMQAAVVRDRDKDVSLDWDRQALAWLQDRVLGSPVIVEANTPIYQWGNRVAVNTGLPALIGWDWHQRQQRALLPAGVVDRRLRDLQTIYNDPDPQLVYDLLRHYDAQYVYVGPLERLYYDADGLKKFDQTLGRFWNLIYENPGVKIYQVLYGTLE